MPLRFFPLSPFLMILLLLAGPLLGGCGSGEQEAQPPETLAGTRVTFRVLPATDAAVPGEAYTLVWRFDLADRWHLYSNSRNDSGFPPRVKLDLPPGWQAGPLQWPTPERYLAAGDLLDHVYHDQLLLLQEVAVPQDVTAGQKVKIPARIDWLVCRDECVPGKAELALEIPVAAEAGPGPGAADAGLARTRLPVPAPPDGVQAAWTAEQVTLTVAGAERLEFYPDQDCVPLRDLVTDGAGAGETLTLHLRPDPEAAADLAGILHQRFPDGSTRNWTIEISPGG